MQVRTGFSLGQGSKPQGIFIMELGSLFAADGTFLFPSLLCASFVFQHLAFWNGPRMPVELPDLDKALLCLWPHHPFRINREEIGRATPPPFFSIFSSGGCRAGAGACALACSARDSFLQKWPSVSVYPNLWWERPGNAFQTLTCLSQGPLCADTQWLLLLNQLKWPAVSMSQTSQNNQSFSLEKLLTGLNTIYTELEMVTSAFFLRENNMAERVPILKLGLASICPVWGVVLCVLWSHFLICKCNDNFEILLVYYLD